MAKNLTDATGAAVDESTPSGNKEHNVEARRAAIRKLASSLRPLETKKAEIGEEMRELRQTFKADTGITLADFDAARRLVEIEDDDERETKMDNIRECFNALSHGDQLDWVEASQAA